MPMITSERIEQGVKVVEAAARCAARDSFKDLETRGIITENNFQRVLSQGNKVKQAVTEALTTLLAELAENTIGRLKLISGSTSIILKSTTGKKMIGKSTSVFAYIDGDFKNWSCNVEGKPTPEMPVQVYEMVKDGTFAQIFGGFGENLDRLCLSQEQIVDFVTDHRQWLRTEGYGTFFLFKVGEAFFVAYVYVSAGGKLRVDVSRRGRDNVWHAEGRPRIVLPQLIPSTT